MLLQNIAFIALGLVGLYYGGDWLVSGASRVAAAFRISPLIIGLTIVAAGTSAPELVVSVLAALDGSEGLAMGNVVGSNIANIGLILGLTGAIRPVNVQESLVRREIPILIVVTIFGTLLILDGQLTRLDGILLLFGFLVFTGTFYFLATNDPDQATAVEVDETLIAEAEATNLLLEAARIIGGCVILVVGAQLMVEGASQLALSVGISEVIVGVTVVAFGTSLPELATSLQAALRGENDIAVGNVIGSNITNLLLVLGATSAIATVDVANDTTLSAVEYTVMIIFTLMLWPFARNRVLDRRESIIFLGLYIAFIIYSFLFL